MRPHLLLLAFLSGAALTIAAPFLSALPPQWALSLGVIGAIALLIWYLFHLWRSRYSPTAVLFGAIALIGLLLGVAL